MQVNIFGALAQLGERLICIQEVRSSILLGSTITFDVFSVPKINLIAKQRLLFSRPIGRFAFMSKLTS